MSALEKLKSLKNVLDWNLATKSGDILPVINEVIEELEGKQPETPFGIEPDIDKGEKDDKGFYIRRPEIVINDEELIDTEKIVDVNNEQNDLAMLAKEYLKEKGTKGLHLYKDDKKIIDKAISEGFIV